MARRERVRYDPANDYYLILGISPTATADEIQTAFRRHAKALHPDRNPDQQATVQFQRLSEAYAILGDPALRAEYDTLREYRSYSAPPAPRPRPTVGRIRWRVVIRGLWTGPYRYVLVVLILVVLLNVVLVVATNQNRPADTPLVLPPITDVPEASPTPIVATPTTALPGQCNPTDEILFPPNNALLPDGAFPVVGAADGAYQLDWALGTPSPTSADSPDWIRLTSAAATPPHGVLVDSSRIAPFIAALPETSEIIFRLTVFPDTNQPVQQCEIAVMIQK